MSTYFQEWALAGIGSVLMILALGWWVGPAGSLLGLGLSMIVYALLSAIIGVGQQAEAVRLLWAGRRGRDDR